MMINCWQWWMVCLWGCDYWCSIPCRTSNDINPYMQVECSTQLYIKIVWQWYFCFMFADLFCCLLSCESSWHFDIYGKRITYFIFIRFVQICISSRRWTSKNLMLGRRIPMMVTKRNSAAYNYLEPTHSTLINTPASLIIYCKTIKFCCHLI